jgi:hypothetical protein
MKFKWATDGYWCYCIASWYGGCISGTSLPCWSHGVLQEPEERPSESWTAFSKRSWWIWWWWSRSAVSGTRASPSCKLSSWGLGAPRWSRCTEAYESSDFKSLLGSWNWLAGSWRPDLKAVSWDHWCQVPQAAIRLGSWVGDVVWGYLKSVSRWILNTRLRLPRRSILPSAVSSSSSSPYAAV